MTPRTYTYTWTQTRLETIQDQFRYLMTYAGFKGNNIDRLVDGVGERAVAAVGVYGCDSSGLRVIEVELRVDWERNAELTLTIPNISSGLSGWRISRRRRSRSRVGASQKRRRKCDLRPASG